jgi:L-histidine Nalpha-methyltransferase
VPLDVSEPALREAAAAIVADYPDLHVHAVVGDFTEPLTGLPGGSPRLVAFLGGTIGNLLPDERHEFLWSVRGVLDEGEWLLLGTDLVKDPTTLVRVYDDSSGVTAEFNRNALHVVNRELGADFPVEAFDHVAAWDPDQEWIEMRLRARRSTRASVPLGMVVDLADGEEIRTEVWAKFRHDRVERELKGAGFDLDRWWTDGGERFALSLARAV